MLVVLDTVKVDTPEIQNPALGGVLGVGFWSGCLIGSRFNYHVATTTLGSWDMDGITRIASKIFHDSWGRLAVFYFAICAFLAVVSAWGDRNQVTSFGWWTLSNAIYLPALFAPFGIAAWVGSKSYKLTGYIWLGRAVGIITAIALSYYAPEILSNTPYIGWRFAKLLSTRDSDY